MKLIFWASLLATATAGPCDIYGAASTPCVAAHSTVRALYNSYKGPLYTVKKYDGTTKDIGVGANGIADSAAQESFCGNTTPTTYTKRSQGQVCEESARIGVGCGGCGPNWGDLSKCQALCDSYSDCNFITFFEDNGCRLYSACKNPTSYSGVVTDIYQRSGGGGCTISRIFDQSPRGNHLDPAPGGGAAPLPDRGVNANKLKLKVGGQTVYGAVFEGGMGYRNDRTNGVAKGDEAESMYMVTGGKHYNGGCCFDYGNAETDNHDDGRGTMEAIYWGDCTVWGKGSGNGPWVMADLEDGLWAGSARVNQGNTPVVGEYVTAMVKGKAGIFALKGGDSQAGQLKTLYEGARPSGYATMKKQGAIILGIGGDNSNGAIGTFFEGVMTSGYSSDATDEAVQANIVAAGYGR